MNTNVHTLTLIIIDTLKAECLRESTAKSYSTWNWTLKQKERREHDLGSLKAEQTVRNCGISVSPHFSGSRCVTENALVVWLLSNGTYRCAKLPFPPLCTLPGRCWSQCHLDLLFNFAGVFSLWILWCLWRQGVWLGRPPGLWDVYLLSCWNYGVAQCTVGVSLRAAVSTLLVWTRNELPKGEKGRERERKQAIEWEGERGRMEELRKIEIWSK